MGTLKYKKNNTYSEIITYDDFKYTEEQLEKMKEEFLNLEKKLSAKYPDYDSKYSYELGKILTGKMREYKIIESERYAFWEMLREYVNLKDKRKTITKLRDAYEYAYMLSKLPEKLAVKYSRSKWDHLFDVTTARKDSRLYIWLENVEKFDFINSARAFQDFCKGLKVYTKNIDTAVYTDEEIFELYNDVMSKALYLDNYMKKNKINKSDFPSKKRDEFFVITEDVDANRYDIYLQKLLQNT
ncbi:MAG: hypothetical protein PHW32_01155 [Bacilli bacterium]|nr:hypothetical protein [Bacilli bacterium]MDD4719101.1 hypothetical protein [Bacilli bacterium]